MGENVAGLAACAAGEAAAGRAVVADSVVVAVARMCSDSVEMGTVEVDVAAVAEGSDVANGEAVARIAVAEAADVATVADDGDDGDDDVLCDDCDLCDAFRDADRDSYLSKTWTKRNGRIWSRRIFLRETALFPRSTSGRSPRFGS